MKDLMFLLPITDQVKRNYRQFDKDSGVEIFSIEKDYEVQKISENVEWRREKLNKKFIQKAIDIHNDKFDYSITFYVASNIKIKYRCSTHGIVSQFPIEHLKRGCPHCLNGSLGENKIFETLRKHGVKFVKEKSFTDCKNINSLRFDFYLPKKNILIEFDGEQHFRPIDFFGGEQGFVDRVQNDKIKAEYAFRNGIKLIRIPHYEYDNIEKIITEII